LRYVLLENPTFAQTLTALVFINPCFSAILIINHNKWAQASINGHAKGFPENNSFESSTSAI
jgi:hypothetical protein